MTEASELSKVLVTGGAESVGLATVRALLRRGQEVAATASDAGGALAIRQAGALPVYPDLSRSSEVLSALRMSGAQVLVHCAPQAVAGLPQTTVDPASQGQRILASAKSVMDAAAKAPVERVISLSPGWLYQDRGSAAREGDPNASDGDCKPMLAAEAALLESGLPGYVLRAGYVYGGNSVATTALAEAIKRSRSLPQGDLPASWIHEDDLAEAIVSLIEAERDAPAAIINADDGSPMSPDDFAAALCQSLGLGEPSFAAGGLMTMLRKETLRDRLLKRAMVIDSRQLREQYGWQPRYPDAAAGMEATSMVWRIKDAINADDYYNKYDDEAAAAIAARVSGADLPQPAAAAEEPAQPAAAVAEQPAPAAAAAPPPPTSEGPTPWNEDDAKREERRRKALERRAKRAAKRGARG